MCRLISKIFILIAAFSLLHTNGYSQKPGAYKCLDFDGTDDYVLIKDHSSLNSDSTITVEAWIKADNYGRNVFDNSIFCKHGWSRGNLGYVLRCGANGKISFNFSDGSGTWREAASASIMETGIWYHVAGSFDGDSVNVYINGQLVGTTLHTGSISPSSGLTARIGDLANGGGRQFDGMIDEVRVWSTDVDEATLRDWMCRKVSSSHPNYANLEGNWKLDEDAGTTTKDASSNSNAGTLTNGPIISLSEAILGDSSVHTYGGTLSSLESKFGDVCSASSITGSPDCFHVVVNYQASEQPLNKGLTGQLDSTHFFSVFYPEDTSVRFTLSYDFGNKKNVNKTQKCGIDLFTKSIGAQGTWSHAGAKYHQQGDSMTLTDQTQSAFGILSYPTDSNSIVTSSSGKWVMCGSNRLDLVAIGNDSFSYRWFLNDSFLSGVSGNTLTVDSAAAYKVEVTRNGTNCSFKSSTIQVSRINKPTVSLSSFNGVCESVDSLSLKGGSPSGGTYSGTGVSGNYFLPSIVKQGNYDITYTFSDTNNCNNEATQTIQVYGLPTLNSSGQPSFCNDKDSVLLGYVTPVGGTYAGKYISNNYFHIDSANWQSKFYPFGYSFTDGNGCSNQLDDSLEIKWATPCTLTSIGQLCNQDDSVKLSGIPANGVYSGKGVTDNYFHPSMAGVGTHTVVYAFTNLLNCTTTDTQQVVIIANGSVSWTQKITSCVNGDSILLKQGSPSGGYFSGAGVTNSNWFKPVSAKVGSHALAYVSIDTNGCENKSWSSAIVYDTTAVTFTGNIALCLFSDPVELTLATPTGGSYAGNGVKSDSLFPKLAGPGNHPVQYTYINSNSCTSNSYVTVEIYKPDSVSISGTDALCVYDDPVVLKTYPSGGKISGKGVIGSVFSPAISGPGSHVIRYAISGSKGCDAFDSIEIKVGDKPSVSITPYSSICEKDDPFELSNGMPQGLGFYRVNGVRIDTISPGTLGQGSHFIEYKVVTDLGCTDSVNTTLVIYPNPGKPLISQSKNNLVSNHLNGNQWYSDTGAISGATMQSFAVEKSGKYYTIVTSDFGCTSTSDIFDFMYVGIQDIIPSWVQIGPNPTKTGFVRLASKKSLEQVAIYDVRGVQLPTTVIDPFLSYINLVNYPNGIYTVVLKTNNHYCVLKLIKL